MNEKWSAVYFPKLEPGQHSCSRFDFDSREQAQNLMNKKSKVGFYIIKEMI